jgi:hypothetical protein
MVNEDPLADILEPLPTEKPIKREKVPSTVPGGAVKYEVLQCLQVTQYPDGRRFYKTLWVKEKGATTQLSKKQTKKPAQQVEIAKAEDIKSESVLG